MSGWQPRWRASHWLVARYAHAGKTPCSFRVHNRLSEASHNCVMILFVCPPLQGFGFLYGAFKVQRKQSFQYLIV